MASAVCLLFFPTQQYEQQDDEQQRVSPTNYTSFVFEVGRLAGQLQDIKQHIINN
jgi:hypothetical protein